MKKNLYSICSEINQMTDFLGCRDISSLSEESLIE